MEVRSMKKSKKRSKRKSKRRRTEMLSWDRGSEVEKRRVCVPVQGQIDVSVEDQTRVPKVITPVARISHSLSLSHKSTCMMYNDL